MKTRLVFHARETRRLLDVGDALRALSALDELDTELRRVRRELQEIAKDQRRKMGDSIATIKSEISQQQRAAVLALFKEEEQ